MSVANRHQFPPACAQQPCTRRRHCATICIFLICTNCGPQALGRARLTHNGAIVEPPRPAVLASAFRLTNPSFPLWPLAAAVAARLAAAVTVDRSACSSCRISRRSAMHRATSRAPSCCCAGTIQFACWAGQSSTARLTVAVDVSAAQLRALEFVALIELALARVGADPHLLNLELTESILPGRLCATSPAAPATGRSCTASSARPIAWRLR